MYCGNRKKEKSFCNRVEARLPAVSSSMLLDIFPFIIVFDQEMILQSIGKSLNQIMPDIVGKKLNDLFYLVRPTFSEEFNFTTILNKSNNFFELMSKEPISVSLKLERQKSIGENITGIYQKPKYSAKVIEFLPLTFEVEGQIFGKRLNA